MNRLMSCPFPYRNSSTMNCCACTYEPTRVHWIPSDSRYQGGSSIHFKCNNTYAIRCLLFCLFWGSVLAEWTRWRVTFNGSWYYNHTTPTTDSASRTNGETIYFYLEIETSLHINNYLYLLSTPRSMSPISLPYLIRVTTNLKIFSPVLVL